VSKIFLDTNFLIYTLDNRDSQKHSTARKLFRAAVTSQSAVISTQVLQEFYVIATKKFGIDPVLVKNILISFENLEIVTVTPLLIREAIDSALISRFSFWDSLILVSAKQAYCEKVWTEDLTPGQIVQGVEIENPFLVF